MPENLAASPLSGFRPDRVRNAWNRTLGLMGVDTLSLSARDGTKLQLTNEGLQKASEDNEFNALLGKIGATIIQNGSYGSQSNVLASEPMLSIYPAYRIPDSRHQSKVATVYNPAAVPDVYIKSFNGLSVVHARTQMATMAWLNRRLSVDAIGVKAVMPYALFESASGKNDTLIMQAACGKSVRSFVDDLDIQEKIFTHDCMNKVIAARLFGAIGRRARLANDLHLNNVFIPIGSVVNADTIPSLPYTLIDQPRVDTIGECLGHLLGE